MRPMKGMPMSTSCMIPIEKANIQEEMRMSLASTVNHLIAARNVPCKKNPPDRRLIRRFVSSSFSTFYFLFCVRQIY